MLGLDGNGEWWWWLVMVKRIAAEESRAEAMESARR
jgi:hypothetical protein